MARRSNYPTKRRRTAGYARRLLFEPLEDRRVLSITVDTLLDVVDANDGHTSLREAIATANANAGAETIDFAPSLTASGPATILLTQGELAITDALSVNGASLLTIDASGDDPTPTIKSGDGSRVFNIGDGVDGTRNAPQFFDATIQGLTITGADAHNRFGGGIFSRENLTLQDCVITGNSVTADTSVYYGSDGGGISSRYANLTITDCTISNNKSSGRAGGMSFDIASFYEGSRLTISGSTIENNTTANKGGGMYWAGDGSITNSTFAGNSATYTAGSGGGLYLDVFTYFTAGERLISGTTFENNSAHLSGGGIYSSFVLNNTLSPAATSLKIVDSHITDNTAGGNGGGIATQSTTSTTGVFAFEMDSTELHHNTAVGNGGGLALMQTFGFLNSVVDGSTFTDNSAASGGGLYASASQLALTNSNFSANTASSQGGGIYLSDSFSTDNCNVTQNTATTGAGIYTSSASTPHTLSRMQIANNMGDGLLLNSSTTTTVNLSNSNISGNQKAGVLANLTASNSGLVVTSSTINSNGASGIRSSSGSLSLTDSQVSNNTSTQSGGGVFAANALTITRCIVSSNMSSVQGGGIATGSAAISITDSQIVGNTAASGGGIESATVTLTHSVLSNNVATLGIGGGASLTKLTATSSAITNNTAKNSGGGISAGTVSLTACQVSNNSTTGNNSGGGGIYAGTVSLTACQVSNNSTTGNNSGGGGIYAGGNLTVSQSTVSGNTTAGSSSPGGGIQSAGGVTLQQSTISGNRTNGATSSGGGIYNTKAFDAFDSTITDNHAFGINSVGGGIRVAPSNYLFTLDRTIIAGNTAAKSNPDLQFHSSPSISISIIGDAAGTTLVESQTPNSKGNRIGNSGGGGVINPKLGSLANNGGPTFLDGSRLLTNALLPGSPAINATNSTGSQNTYDERGTPWHRDIGFQDIGAVESQPNPLPGDYNFNGVVDASDFLVWRLTNGSTTDLRADADGSGTVDQADYNFWRSHFSLAIPAAGSSEQALTGDSVENGAPLDSPQHLIRSQSPPLEISVTIAPENVLSQPAPTDSDSATATTLAPFQNANTEAISDLALLAWLQSRGDAKHAILSTQDYCVSESMPAGSETLSGLSDSLRLRAFA